MVKAKIGKTEIEGTAEEVAYILNGLIASEKRESVEVIHEAAPETEAKIRAPRYKTLGEAAGFKMKGRYRWRGGKKIPFKAILGCTLKAWLQKNYPNLAKFKKRKKVIRALRAAGVPYSISKRKLTTAISSAMYAIKHDKPAGYTKEEVEEIEQDID